MGFFRNTVSSFKKSGKLSKLQRIIHPPNEGINDLIKNIRNPEVAEQKQKALQEYLDMCYNDVNIAAVMDKYKLKRTDLENIYIDLNSAGFGQWIKGHFVSLSTIAYPEPLIYYCEAKSRGEERMNIIGNLLFYWEGKIRQGQLLHK